MSLSPSVINYGESVTLTWNAAPAQKAYFDNGIGEVPASGTRTLTPEYTTTYAMTAVNDTQTTNHSVSVKVLGHPPEPQPEGSFGKDFQDLVPENASLPAYDPKRFIVITGIVKDESDNPLEAVTVEIFKHPEYGTAQTDLTGRFSLPAEGGSNTTLVYSKPGYISSHRSVDTPWNDIVVMEERVLVAQDAISTAVVFDGDPDTVIRHMGTETIDAEDGNRSCTIVFSGDNMAYETDSGGNIIRPLPNIEVRATEFTTPQAMPAVLPPASAFTYCVEMEAEGASRVKFDKPVVSYVDNFLEFPVGGIVPVGYYDRDKGEWIASKNGVVVKLLDTDGDGTVDALDATGDSLADDLDSDGDFSDEVKGLDDKTIYAPGTTYWRFATTHFTPWDCNWPYIPPPDFIPPNPQGPPYEREDVPCFAVGTLVQTSDGLKSIEAIKPGDQVWSRYENDSNPVLRNVSRIFVTPDQETLAVTFETTDGKGETLSVTPEHPFWVKDHGWMAAHLLKPGDEVQTIAGVWAIVGNGGGSSRKQAVYNLEVEDAHTYFVGGTGLWVHNSCNGDVEPRNRILHEDVHIPGTDISLHYSSERTKGYKHKIEVPLSGDAVPASLISMNAVVWVAGKGYSAGFSPGPNQKATFYWDGLNYRGNPVYGTVKAKVEIHFYYYANYAEPKAFGNAFGQFGSNVTIGSIRNMGRIVVTQTDTITIKTSDYKKMAAEGWSLSDHHSLGQMDRSTLFKGDGGQEDNSVIGSKISTVAGNGKTSLTFGGEGGSAVSTATMNPGSIAVDGAGNFYFCSLHRILKVDANGIITSVAGSDDVGSTGDGGPAKQAKLQNPSGITFDNSGNLYIADPGTRTVRRIDTNGIITTVAGKPGVAGNTGDNGPAVKATLFQPYGLAVDIAGNLYISDNEIGVVRKVDTNGIITTVCSLQTPKGMAFDSSGNLYIASERGNKIYKLDTSGKLKVVAGTGREDFGGDGGPAKDAYLNWPTDVAVDPQGNLYIADLLNQCIRMVNTDGIIATIAGRGSNGDGGLATESYFYYPRGVALDPKGDLYISDCYRARVRKVKNQFSLSGYTGLGNILFPDKNGLFHLMSYTGQHLKTFDQDTNTPLLTFDYDGVNLTGITDRFGKTTEIRWTNGVPVEIESPYGLITHLSVNEQGHLEDIVFPDSATWHFDYTDEGLMTGKRDPEYHWIQYDYTSAGRLETIQDEEGGLFQYLTVNENNGDIVTTVATAEGNETEYRGRYSKAGIYSSKTTTNAGDESTFERSADDLKESLTRPCLDKVEYTYTKDPKYDFKVTQSMKESSGGITRNTTFGRLYEDTNGDKTPDRITKTITTNGHKTTSVHDVLNATRKITSPKGRTITSAYDPDTLLVSQVTQAGLSALTYTYYPETSAHSGRIHTMTTGSRTVQYTYNDDGNLHSIIDPEGRATVFELYDAAGRVKTVRQPNGGTIQYDYDLNGNMTVLTTPFTIDHGFGYTSLGFDQSYTAPLSGTILYQYDKDRRLTNESHPSGAQIIYDYEDPVTGDKSKLVQIRTPEGNIDYTYTPCGNKLESISNGTEAITYAYNDALLTQETLTGNALNTSIQYIYNSDGDFDLDGLTYAGDTETLTYDDDGLLTGAGDFVITRNVQNGLPESISNPTLALGRTFNGYGETNGVSYDVAATSAGVWSVLARDNSGRIKEKTETIGSTTHHYLYSYDTLGRLLTVTRDTILVESYEYETTAGTCPGFRCTYGMNSLRGITGRTLQYDTEDHLLVSGSTTYEYDLDGKLSLKRQGTDETLYTYSSRGELLSVSLPDGRNVEYLHDPLGRRIAKKIDGIITERYLWAGQTRLLAVYDGQNNLSARFLYADDRMPLIMEKAGAVYYMVYNQVGSLMAVTDNTGNIVKQIDYDSFGFIIADSNPAFEVPFGFAGGLHDKDTGLVRFGYRDYDPDTGRWTAKDPILFDGGDADLYGYCVSDPVNTIDPYGLDAIVIVDKNSVTIKIPIKYCVLPARLHAFEK